MGFELVALFLETKSGWKFGRYFWDGTSAIEVGETLSIFNGEKIIGYKIETHKLPLTFEHYDISAYYSLAKYYQIL